MSLSADNNGSYPRGISSGKTPPPAPSAAFAKRAMELQAEEQQRAGAARYRPPALRGLPSGGPEDISKDNTPVTTLPPNNFSPGFRRARAGTLPSNVQLAAQNFAATTNPLSRAPTSSETLSEQLRQQSAAASLSASVRPTLRHSATAAPIAGTVVPNERHSRLRSGSLTLPSAGLSNAFGPSLFASSWMSSNNGSGNGFPVLDELRSVTSDSEDFNDVHTNTLDYLGLDDSLRQPPAATLSELRNQAQAAIAGNLANPSSRLRANTVSNPYRVRGSNPGSLLGTPMAPEDEEEIFANYDSPSNYNRPRINSINSYAPVNDTNYDSYMTKNYKQNDLLTPPTLGSRPRAISVGNLDDPMRSLQRRAGGAEVQQSSYLNELPSQNSGLTAAGLTGMYRTENIVNSRTSPNLLYTGNDNSQSRASAYLAAPGSQGRSVSPKQDNSQIQTPTRSLWIGNLDSAVTSEQLIHVFAPYGAIESLRLLPEKECGFVNFVEQADAIRAKEDVLNRLGGNIGMPNGQTVRIGFGKADSAPVAPAKGSTVTGPPAMAGPGKNTVATAAMSGMEAQLQSTPTRALWIGSIPSTTTPATILSVFSPYGPIESARVLTHKNCGFINFERLDDAVRARKALNGRDVLGSDVGAIRIGFAKVPVKNGSETGVDEAPVVVQGIGDLSVGATIHALRNIKGASTVPADQQVLGGAVENYRSNLLLSMIASGGHGYVSESKPGGGWMASVTEQMMIMKELSAGAPESDGDVESLRDIRPPIMYYTTIPLVSDRPNSRRWDAAKLRELRKRLDSGTMSAEDVDQVSGDFLDGEIVDLASDWLGNTVVQKLFEKCSSAPRFAMLERLGPHLAMIGIHKNGTWAAQKVIECVQSPEEVALITQNLRPYAPPLLLDQFGNYVVQCCLRFNYPNNDFIFDAMVDRIWEVAQGRFGARSMRACLESPHITVSQQRRVATAIILNSIPLATNPNGALLLTWLLDSSGFPSRYNLLAPRFTPHLSHLCTHKLASLTVLRIVNQKIEPAASTQIVDALFSSPGDHVLTDVLGDQVNGVAVVHKILTSPFLDPVAKESYVEATKRVLIELKVIATQAYRRLIEEVGLPVPSFQPTYNAIPQQQPGPRRSSPSGYTLPGLPTGYPSNDQGLASMMAALQMGGQNPQSAPPPLHIDPGYSRQGNGGLPPGPNPNGTFSPSADPFNPFGIRTPDASTPRTATLRRTGSSNALQGGMSPAPGQGVPYGGQSPMTGSNPLMGMTSQTPPGMAPPNMQPQMYQNYLYQAYQQGPQGMGAYHA